MNAERNHSLPHTVKRKASWDGISVVHYRFGPGDLPEHHNKDHLIALSLNDNCRGEIRLASGFQPRDKNKGSVCVIPSGHRFALSFEEESEHLAILLDPALVQRASAESRYSRVVELLESSAPGDPVINSIALALLAELEGNNSGRLYAESLAHVLALHLVRNYSGNVNHRFTGGLTGQKLRTLIEFINLNYQRDLSLAELATVAGMSTFHFAREFKKSAGTTPHQYLLKLRIQRAKELLSESQMPLVDVGFHSGFSHQSHFTRLFRKLTGTTPLNYRLMFQG